MLTCQLERSPKFLQLLNLKVHQLVKDQYSDSLFSTYCKILKKLIKFITCDCWVVQY